MTPDISYQRRGFSLVEVVFALGIVSFAVVSMLGLLPLGLSNFRAAMETSVVSQILQQVSSHVQGSDFDRLADLSTKTLYFDDQGNMVSETCPAKLYAVNLVLLRKGGDIKTDLPGHSSFNLATLTVQIAANPGNRNLVRDAATGLWPEGEGISISSYPLYVSRSN